MRKSVSGGLMVIAVVAGFAFGAEPVGQVTGWRGDGTGNYAGAMPPTKWDEAKKQGIVWKVKLPTSQYNTPVVCGEKVFVLAEPNKVICLDTKTGKELWSKTTGAGDLAAKVELLPEKEAVGNTTPTPVTDGKNLYVVFANGLVTAFDFEGNRKWVVFRDMPCDSEGRSASPCIADGKLIVSTGYLAALDCATGKELWKAEKAAEQFGSPVAAKIGDLPVVVAPGGQVVNAKDGTIIDKTKGETTHTTPVVAGGVAYFIDSDSVAVKLSATKGESKKLWSAGDVEGEFFASPVVHEGLVYTVSNKGDFFVVDATNGKLAYKKELEIANQSGKPGVPVGSIYQSLCLAGGNIYVSNDRGETLVVKPGREYSEVAHNELKDDVAGSMVIAGKRIFVRGKESLYCIE